MKRLVTLTLAIALCAGCATAPTPTPGPPRTSVPSGQKAGFLESYSESRRLRSAVALLEKGDSAGASKILEEICNGKVIPGVTDEALFRLGLLTLKQSPDRGHQLLRRLKKEYPSSPWTVQAAPVSDVIGSAEELRRQNRNYRSTNQTLTKEVSDLNKTINDLNKNIEQLKHLDLELEKKAR